MCQAILGLDKSDKIELITATFDTGSEVSMVGLDLFERLGRAVSDLDKSESFSIASTTQVKEDCVEGTLYSQVLSPVKNSENPSKVLEKENLSRENIKKLWFSQNLH